MADVNRGNRPLSPHIGIYKPQITSIVSILHRITGIAMTLFLVLFVWWLIAASTSTAYFIFVDGIFHSWIGLLVLAGTLWAFWFHFLNGIRHLFWDSGLGFEMKTVSATGWSVVIGSLVLTAGTIGFVWG